MGVNEDELGRIAARGQFEVPEIAAVRRSLTALAATMKRVAGHTGSDGESGWTGLAARAASEKMERLSRRYYKVAARVADLEAAIDAANGVRARALEAAANLPPANAPSWVHGALDVFDFPGIPQPVDLAQGGLAIIEDFLGDQREKAAAAILANYHEQLEGPQSDAMSARLELLAYSGAAEDVVDHDDSGRYSEPVPGGTVGGGGYAPGRYTSWPGTSTPFSGYVDPDVHVGVDDPSGGVTPGTPGTSTPGLGGGAAGGIPAVAGAGAGAGVALTGASTAAAMKLGAGAGMGGTGLVNRPGTGGLLGAGTAGAPGTGAGAKSSGAGTRGTGSGLLGGGGGAAGVGGANAGDKKRRAAGNGLGGPMAPKLDDDDEYVPQAPGARAGERSGPTDEVDALDPDA